MNNTKTVRYVVIFTLLLAGVWWSMASATAQSGQGGYPEKNLLVDAKWLAGHQKDPNLLVVDVRDDKYFDWKLIPGAIRLPWSQFRMDSPSTGIGGAFVGAERAQEILGNAGITRNDTLVLYDSVARDGAATASYVFWILDLLGHSDKMILERGIDSWIDLGKELASEPKKTEPVLYQALAEKIDLRKMADGAFIQDRLADPHYQILDVRSREEYLGQKANTALDGDPLLPGHIPTAVNIDYTLNWSNAETKAIKNYAQLQQLYRGLDPDRAVITYCHSGRRSSFSYFILRLMGFSDVILYDASWFEWGNPNNFFPVQTTENEPAGTTLPSAGKASGQTLTRSAASRSEGDGTATSGRQKSAPDKPQGGYVSCGG